MKNALILQQIQGRVEVTKPLDTYLLFQKIAFFEHALSTLLEEHHQMGLHMLAKTSFRQARKKRKRYIIQELFNGKLERLSRVVSLSDQQVRKERQMILKDYGEKYQRQKCNKKLSLQQQFSKKYEKLQIQSEKGCIYSRKIISKLNLVGEPQDELISISEDEEHKQKNPQTLQNNLQTNTELIRSNQTL